MGMAKLSSRRRSVLEDPDEVLDLAQRGLEYLKSQWKWLLAAAVVVAAVLLAVNIRGRMQTARGNRAATALVEWRTQYAAPGANPEAAKALKELVKKYAGTKAAAEAELLRANILYHQKNYADAAQAYESLQKQSDPAWNTLISESLSYCYEGLGEFKKAAAALKPVEEASTGPFQGEVTQRLALLYDKAGNPAEAAVYWHKLLEKAPDQGMKAYFQERLAKAEAQAGPAKK
jgi:lipopolysaccharide biosynthesis regulator YciM